MSVVRPLAWVFTAVFVVVSSLYWADTTPARQFLIGHAQVAVPPHVGAPTSTHSQGVHVEFSGEEDKVFLSDGSLGHTATYKEPRVTTELRRDTMIVFDALGECTAFHRQRLRRLVGDAVDIIIKVPQRGPVASSGEQGAPPTSADGTFVSNSALGGIWMVQESLRILVGNNGSSQGASHANGFMIILLDFRRSDVRCISPFVALRSPNGRSVSERSVFVATPPIRVPADVLEVTTNFHRSAALWKMSFKQRNENRKHFDAQSDTRQRGAVQTAPSLLPELHHFLYFGPDSWKRDAAAQSLLFQPRLQDPKAIVSSAFFAGSITSLASLLSLVCKEIGCFDDDIDDSLPLEPILTHISMTLPSRHDAAELNVVRISPFPCSREPPLCAASRITQDFLVIDTTPDCIGDKTSLHGDVVLASKSIVAAASDNALPRCPAQYQLSGDPRTQGVTRLITEHDDMESIDALMNMSSHSWDNTHRTLDTWKSWRDGNHYWIPHTHLRPFVHIFQRHGNVLPPLPATPCAPGEHGSNVTVVVTMATRYHPRRISEFVHTFLRTQENLTRCRNGSGFQYPAVLVAIVTNPWEYTTELLQPGMWTNAAREPPVVFLSLALWRKFVKKSSPLKKCKVVVSRFPMLLLLLRVIHAEWRPSYAVMSDSRDVLFQTNIGDAIVEVDRARGLNLTTVYGSVPPPTRHASRQYEEHPPGGTPTQDFLAIVLERAYLGTPDMFSLTPYTFNRLWLAQTFGDAFAWRVVETAMLRVNTNQLVNRSEKGIPFPVACAGVFFGTTSAVIDAIRLLVDTLVSGAKCRGNDQGVLVALTLLGFARSGFPHNVVLLDPYHSQFTHGLVDDSGRNMRWDAQGRLVNCHGVPYAVLHQMDRLEGPYNFLVHSINVSKSV